MRIIPRGWSAFIVFAACGGGLVGFNGHDPTDDGSTAVRLGVMAGVIAALTLIVVLCSPVLIRLNGGRWDAPKARAESARVLIGSVPVVALLLAGAAVNQIAVHATGGWSKGWPSVPLATLIGAATAAGVGVPLSFLVERLRKWLGIPEDSLFG
jgi:hypothetical protein